MAPPVDVVTVVSVALLGLALAGVIVFVVLAIRQSRAAWAEPLRRVAEANGWRYEEHAPRRLTERFARFMPLRRALPKDRGDFAQGPPRDDVEVGHVITGRAFRHHFHQFQVTWRVPEEVRRRDGGPAVRRYAVCAVLMNERAGLALRLARRDHLPQRSRRQASDVEVGDRLFRSRFLVLCQDAEFAREVLPPAATRYLTRSRMDWEWHGPWLVVHWEARLKSPDVLTVLRRVLAYTRRLPEKYHVPPPRFVLDDEEQAEAA